MIAIDQFAAHVGLDWADKKHDVCVQFKNGERIFHVVEHTPEALDIWLNELHQKVKGRIAIALELKKGPVVHALQKYPFVTVFPVHALSLARYRQAFSPSGAKDDPQDAELALELMLRYPTLHRVTVIERAAIGAETDAVRYSDIGQCKHLNSQRCRVESMKLTDDFNGITVIHRPEDKITGTVTSSITYAGAGASR